MKFLILFLAILNVLPAMAYVEAQWTSGAFNPSLRTYVVVAGEGFDDMGPQFAKSALSEVRKIRDFDSQAQVVLFVARGDDDMPSSSQISAWAPDANVMTVNALLTGTRLLQRLTELQSIAGIYTFSHSTPMLGAGLQAGYERFSPQVTGIELLKTHFTPDAVVAFFGCNIGYGTGPGFSKIWGVPVMGSLTSTNFQQLHSNGNFYGNDPGLYPSGGWSSANNTSYDQSWKCPGGECLRMRPDNTPYTGIWGSFSAGLGFYKWFCDEQVSDARCLQGMRTGAHLWIGSTNLDASPNPSQVVAFLNDFFCPEDASFSQHNLCVQGISKALQTRNNSYSAFSGQSLNCSFLDCNVDVNYTNNQHNHFVIHPHKLAESNTTMMDEVHAYLKAFNLE